MAAGPAPFCRIELGALEVTFVPDGVIRMAPVASFPGSRAEQWAANPQYLDDDGLVVMSLGALLVRTAGRTALIDLAWGPTTVAFGDDDTAGGISGGRLLDNLAKLGVRPTDVDVVLFSHLHGDHVGWALTPEGGLTFANATHHVGDAEWSYWSTEGRLGVGAAPSAEHIAGLDGSVSFLADGDRPLPGVDVVATPGHTPGHLSFVLSSGSERAVVLGDAVHCPIEIGDPEMSFLADVDPTLARSTREHIERELLGAGAGVVGPHFPDLVFGRLLPGRSWQFPASQVLP